MIRLSWYALLAIVFLGSTCPAQQARVDAESGSVKKKISDLIDPLVRSNNYSGNVVISKAGKRVFEGSYGLADVEKGKKTNAKTRYFLASISAVFTSAATMKLVDSGKLSLDDKVSKFLPGFRNGDKMTVHHLLTERTGIPRIGSQGSVNYSSLTESPQTIDQLIGYFKDYPLSFEPGSQYEHSRSSYILLAKIIEVVSGQSFGEFLKKEVFEPLDMHDSGHFEFADKYDEIPDLARGYSQSGVTELEPAQAIHWSSKTGHASIYSTAEDLLKFATAALNKKLLSAGSWKRTLTAHHGDGVGYGWFVSSAGSRKHFYTSGGSPGFATFVDVYPDEDLVVVMLSNIQIHVPYFTVPKIVAVVFGEPYENLDLVMPPDVAESVAESYIGTYRFENGFYNPRGIVVITRDKGRLFADGGPLIPIKEGNKKITRFIHRRYWSTLEFVADEKGNFSELRFDDFVGKRSTSE